MTDSEDMHLGVVRLYENEYVRPHHPTMTGVWPILSGYTVTYTEFGEVLILIFKSTGLKNMVMVSGIDPLDRALIGADEINDENRELVRGRIEAFHDVGSRGAVFFLSKGGLPRSELAAALRKHEHAMGLIPVKIFLSHKGVDKELVRDFEKTMRLLGFDPWLDEDAMSAGATLERALLKGFADSCAVVFFVTKNYVDENYLATEVNYAVAEKRKKGDRFSIITLALDGCRREQCSRAASSVRLEDPKNATWKEFAR